MSCRGSCLVAWKAFFTSRADSDHGHPVQVYLGRWRWHGLVAVKQLIEADERREQAFVREAELLQALRHPNIVSFLGACLEPGRVRTRRQAKIMPQ